MCAEVGLFGGSLGFRVWGSGRALAVRASRVFSFFGGLFVGSSLTV